MHYATTTTTILKSPLQQSPKESFDTNQKTIRKIKLLLLLSMPTISVGVGRIFESVVCLFVCLSVCLSVCPFVFVLFWGLKVKDQGHRVSKFILHTRTLHTRTAIYRHSLGGVTTNQSPTWVRNRDRVP